MRSIRSWIFRPLYTLLGAGMLVVSDVTTPLMLVTTAEAFLVLRSYTVCKIASQRLCSTFWVP
jgi:hypothetical protein